MLHIDIEECLRRDMPMAERKLQNLLMKLKIIKICYRGKETLGWNVKVYRDRVQLLINL